MMVRWCGYPCMACGCGYAHAVHKTIDTLYYYDKTNMDSRLSSSSEKTTGRDLDLVESGSSLKSARDKSECPGCEGIVYSCTRYFSHVVKCELWNVKCDKSKSTRE